MLRRMSCASIVVIGNEILTGKIADQNTPFLLAELRSLGVQVREIVVIPDQIEHIAEALSRVCPRSDFVFTSGGIGPTHDDVTIEGIAAAFSVETVRDPTLEKLLREYAEQQKQPLTDAHLRMALVPKGAQLLVSPDLRWPLVQFQNVYILPGIPEIFRRKFLAIRDRFRDTPFCLRNVYVRCDEGLFAEFLRSLAARFSDVSIGSYPRVHPAEDGHRVRITLEGKNPERIEAATQQLADQLGKDVVSVS
jgi:molybdenum cofactor synthesis domain-containing protein